MVSSEDDAVTRFELAILDGHVPVAVPVRTADGQTVVAVTPFARTGRVAATLAHPDLVVRARLLAGLMSLARNRARSQIDAG
jgi:hypothetical protein